MGDSNKFRSVIFRLFLLTLPCFVSLQVTAAVKWAEEALRLDYLGLSQKLDVEALAKSFGYLQDGLNIESLPDIEITDQPVPFFDVERRRISVPFSLIYRSFEGLRIRFPEQQDIRESIFVATVHFLLLSKMSEALVSEFEWEIAGWPEERVDALTTIILLHSKVIDSRYLLDAAEEYLILDRSRAAFQGDRFKNEFEEDEYRLRQILCLISGFDAKEMLADESLGRDVKETFKQCKARYQAAQDYWKSVLEDRLQKSTPLHQLLTIED